MPELGYACLEAMEHFVIADLRSGARN